VKKKISHKGTEARSFTKKKEFFARSTLRHEGREKENKGRRSRTKAQRHEVSQRRKKEFFAQSTRRHREERKSFSHEAHEGTKEESGII
jgi:hypothetical protein